MSNMTDAGQTIGAIARAAGVHVETVRYYERIGLLPRPPRPQGTFRRYPAEALQRIRFIKRAQWFGFSLEEIAVLLALAVDGCCGRSRALGEMKLSMLRRRLDELLAAQSALQTLVSRCAEARGPRCPLIDALMDEGNSSLKDRNQDSSTCSVHEPMALDRRGEQTYGCETGDAS